MQLLQPLCKPLWTRFASPTFESCRWIEWTTKSLKCWNPWRLRRCIGEGSAWRNTFSKLRSRLTSSWKLCVPNILVAFGTSCNFERSTSLSQSASRTESLQQASYDRLAIPATFRMFFRWCKVLVESALCICWSRESTSTVEHRRESWNKFLIKISYNRWCRWNIHHFKTKFTKSLMMHDIKALWYKRVLIVARTGMMKTYKKVDPKSVEKASRTCSYLKKLKWKISFHNFQSKSSQSLTNSVSR